MSTSVTERYPKVVKWGESVLGIAGILLFWYLITDGFGILSDVVLPSPVAVVLGFWEFRDLMITWMWPTLISAGVGFIVALTLALVIGVTITLDKRIENALMPIALAGNSVPRVTLAPLILFYAGTGVQANYIIAAWIAFFPTLVNIVDGLKQIEREHEYMLKLLGASTYQEYRFFRAPNALPYFFDALKFAATLSFIGAILGEFVGQSQGLGFLVLTTMMNHDLDLAFAAVFITGTIGMIIVMGIFLLQDRIVFWQESSLLE